MNNEANEYNLSLKLNFCYNFTLIQTEDINNPITKLLSDFNEIKNILTINNPNLLKFLYFNRNKIHKILYEFEEIIDLDGLKTSFYLYLYFYLSLLIEENPNVINYKYSINFIRNLNEEQIKENNKIIKKIILAKIIIVLISNYTQNENADEDGDKYEEELNKIKKYNDDIIHNNKKVIKIFNLEENDILKKDIGKIYVQIIKYLIINQKLEDIEYAYNIIEQIDLESINLTKNMYIEISKILDKNESYLNKYIITKYEDIFNNKIITFYYVLLKYILKSKFYIYDIPFLLDARNNIKKLIRNNLQSLNPSISENENKDKIEYVLKSFISYDWYNKKSIKINIDNYNNRSNISNQNEISSQNYIYSDLVNSSSYSSSVQSIHSPLSNQSIQKYKELYSGRSIDMYEESPELSYEELNEMYKDDICYRILKKSEFIYNVNRKDNNISIILEKIIIMDGKNEQIDYDTLMNMTSKFKNINNNYQKFLSFIKNFQNKLRNEITNNISFKLSLSFNIYYMLNSKFKIKCEYCLEIPGEKDKNTYKDDNILIDGFEGNMYLFMEIKNNIDE